MTNEEKALNLLLNLHRHHDRMRTLCMELWGAMPGSARHTKVSRKMGETEALFEGNYNALKTILYNSVHDFPHATK